jgi:hypothetical protein
VDLIRQGVHLLLVDLFPLSAGEIHQAIWTKFANESFESPGKKPLTLVAYQAISPVEAYLEPLAVGDELPSMPILLAKDCYVLAPLEETYRASWAAYSASLKLLLAGP